MHLILIIAAGILLAFFLLPFLGPIIILIFVALIIGGIIWVIIYTIKGVASIKDSMDLAKQEQAAHKKWLESLPEDERNAQIKEEKKAVMIVCAAMVGVTIIVLWIVWPFI